MKRTKKYDDFFDDFSIFTTDELKQMDFFLSNMRFFEKGVLKRNMPDNFKIGAEVSSNIWENDPENCFFLIVPKSDRSPENTSRRAA